MKIDIQHCIFVYIINEEHAAGNMLNKDRDKTQNSYRIVFPGSCIWSKTIELKLDQNKTRDSEHEVPSYHKIIVNSNK